MATTVQLSAQAHRPLVTIILPAYNEAGVLVENVGVIFDHLHELEAQYRFEVIIVNDGSRDATGSLAEELRGKYANLKVLHHRTNFGLGQAFKTAFAASRGDYVITMDVDLSYAPDHIELLLDKLVTTPAKLVLASPYMRGGQRALTRASLWCLACREITRTCSILRRIMSEITRSETMGHFADLRKAPC